jgi:hypothetical protein
MLLNITAKLEQSVGSTQEKLHCRCQILCRFDTVRLIIGKSADITTSKIGKCNFCLDSATVPPCVKAFFRGVFPCLPY